VLKMNDYTLPAQLQQLISADQAYHYRIVPFSRESNITIFKSDSLNCGVLREELTIVLGIPVKLIEEETEVISKYLSVNYRKPLTGKISEIHYSSDFLEKIIINAKEIGSSDIHFEPYESRARIRFRLDGKLKEYFTIAIDEYPVIVNKLKIRSQMDISEKRLPQDGRISVSTDNQDFDVRVSVMPTLYGEKIVLRLLSKDTSRLDLASVGFTSDELGIYQNGLKKPNGIILISGPTGSGKTTTLYATLKYLNRPNINILTVEDPIEYTLEGINQVQLKENIGLGFAATLKTFLRQDPDILMVGEIRDVETANMAIRAALTGHLVLSTIHTNSAWSTVSRLIDMGIPSFLIASTLNISIAQRLVRKLCNHCKLNLEITDDLFPDDFIVPEDLFSHYIPTGCTECYHTGYFGRKAIYEILPIDKELMSLIKNNALEIDAYIENKNIFTLKKNALELIKDGTTSIEEVYPILME
jgi:type IV pilus assembly protein PilB